MVGTPLGMGNTCLYILYQPACQSSVVVNELHTDIAVATVTGCTCTYTQLVHHPSWKTMEHSNIKWQLTISMNADASSRIHNNYSQPHLTTFDAYVDTHGNR